MQSSGQTGYQAQPVEGLPVEADRIGKRKENTEIGGC